MGRKCRHEHAFARVWVGGAGGNWIFLCGDSSTADARRCVDCHEWLSLGPSNDSPEAVRIEIRAAEIAASGRPPKHNGTRGTRGRGTYIGCAGCGWNGAEGQLLEGKPSTEAGRLARQITHHDNEAA